MISCVPLPPPFPGAPGTASGTTMEHLIEDLATAIPGTFESDEYRARLRRLQQTFAREEREPFQELDELAETLNIAVLQTPGGFSLAPVKDGEVIDPETFAGLSEEEKKEIENTISELQEKLEEMVKDIPKLRREFRRRLKELNREVTESAIRILIDEVRGRYEGEEAILSHLETVFEDVLDNAHLFHLSAQQEEGGIPFPIPGMTLPDRREDSDPFAAYRVNLLVDNANTDKAPVITEENPTFPNIVGRIEHYSEMGALTTDFTLIRPGALHRANGGYLILDARTVLMEPFAWEGLKRAIRTGVIRTESLGQAYGLVSTVTLEPECIPLDVKVILTGDRLLYYLLSLYDPDFSKLFRVAADFDDDLPRNEENDHCYARLIADVSKREGLLPLSASGVARVLDEAAREANHSGKLSLQLDSLRQLLEESDHWARDKKAGTITSDHVETAIENRRHRSGRLREKALEQVLEGTKLIDTDGEAVGQINGLSVLSLGEATFGQPTRITARTRPGAGGVIDIEREAKLGGPLHSKGILILTGYLAGQFRKDGRLSLSASLVFEQSYGGVDGDSASSAELYALLSSLSGIPIRQSFAVTGSVNQHGEIQAIGGVNEKIEGFFEICRERGLRGDEAVLIPESNVKHLMLREEVVEACRKNQFRIYPVKTIEQGIELLTGVEAGERDEKGEFPPESLFGKVEENLDSFARAMPWDDEDDEGKKHHWFKGGGHS